MNTLNDNNNQKESGQVALFIFRLYVAGSAPNSLRAIGNLMDICQEYLPERHQIEIVDVLQDPLRAITDKVLVTPTLIKVAPEPTWSMLGDLSAREKVLLGLGIEICS
ncbi:MAG: circadian clock KaiB family protein [Chloroflexota bacterium]